MRKWFLIQGSDGLEIDSFDPKWNYTGRFGPEKQKVILLEIPNKRNGVHANGFLMPPRINEDGDIIDFHGEVMVPAEKIEAASFMYKLRNSK